MKQLKYVLFLLFLSCHTGNNQSKEAFFSDIEFDLSDKGFMDSTFHRDFDSYIKAFLDGNANTAIKYLHPSIYEYFKKEYPEEILTEDDIKELLLKKPYREIFQKFQKNGVKFEFKIDTPLKIIADKDITFIVANTHMISTRGLDKISTGEKLIGVSNDKGKNWQFIQISNNAELSRKILETITTYKIVENLLN